MSGERRRGRLFTPEPRREVEDELSFHLEERVREYMGQGMDEAAARRAALERIGDFERVRDECASQLVAERRSLARRDWLSDLQQDVRFGVRSALRAPLFTLMAVVTLALGIGANSAVFGVVKSVLLNPLPYPDADRLVRVEAPLESSPELPGPLSAGTVHDLTQRQRSFSDVGASMSGGQDAVLQIDAGAVGVRLAAVQPGFFRALGVQPAFGRMFDDSDVAAAVDTARAVLLTHDLWQQRFGGSHDVLNQSMVLNGIARTIIGVLPRGFVHPVRHTDIYIPLNLEPWLQSPVASRGSHNAQFIGRLAPGVTLEAARAEVAAIGKSLAEEYPEQNRGRVLRAESLRTSMAGDTRMPLLVLMASAALVLLIACANLAGALLSRTIARRREFAVRVSLGAGRSRLVRQLLAESALLALVGGAAGLLLAYFGLGLLRGAQIEGLPQYAALTLDAGAVTFTFVLALFTGFAFGLSPALSIGQVEPQAVLRDESRSASESRGAGTLRGLLVAGQVALCLSLLAGAGLLGRSLWLMASEPPGFDTRNTLTFSVTLPAGRYPTAEAQMAFRDEMTARLGALAGVQNVAVTNFLPTRVGNSNGVSVIGREVGPDAPPQFVMTTAISEDFFATLGIPVVSGRTFTIADNLDAPPVAVISETMARRFWPDGGAVGAYIRVGPDPDATPVEVIGVVGDVRTDLAERDAAPMLYMSQRQGWWGSTFVLRTAGDPLRYGNLVRRELAAVDRALPVTDPITLADVMSDGLAARRLPMLLMLTFSALALLLACIGIYALFANMAAARQREFGVRMALGSSRAAVARLMLRQGALWMALGLAGGALGVYAVSRALRSLVYGIAPLDHVSIAAAVGALVIAAAVALAVPVVRATRSDPVSVMR